MKYQPISIPNNEAQFLETRKFQVEEIARLYRVPLHMIGDLDRATFSNIEQQSLEFVKYTLDPWLVRWEQSLQKSLLSEKEKGKYFIKFNVEGLLRGDYASRMQGYATARQNGWMSANVYVTSKNSTVYRPKMAVTCTCVTAVLRNLLMRVHLQNQMKRRNKQCLNSGTSKTQKTEKLN